MVAHRINHAQVELEVAERELAQALIERVSSLHELRLAPLLDRVCSEHSGPERIDRIDCLELELGSLDADDFEAQFIERVEAALRSALAKHLHAGSDRGARTQAALELVETFAWTGNLPWWADASAVDPVTVHSSLLAREAPGPLLRLLRELADHPRALARVLARLDDRALIGIARAEPVSGLPVALREAIVSAHARVEGSRAELRASEVDPAKVERLHDSNEARLPRAARQQLAPEAPSGLVDDEERRELASQWRDAQATAASDPGRRRPSDVEPTALPADQRQPPASATKDPDTEGDIPRPEHASNRGGETSDRAHEARTTDIPRASSATAARTGAAIKNLHPGQLPTAESEQELSERHELVALHASEPRGVPPLRLPTAKPPHPARRRALERLDELYVDDAGLVILWPFLLRFFARLELVDEQRRFVDEPARMRAIMSLEQLAFEQPDRPEYMLPLAKLLCGLAPTDDLVSADPLAPEHAEEAERLLAAVIDNAPILRAMPVPRFRVGFLQRPAVLRVHDGSWLLRVERHSHDLVLERFPWSWAWVKLPWMPDPLRVEW